jgi:hypothetical protein
MLEDQRWGGSIAPFDDVEPDAGGVDLIAARFGHDAAISPAARQTKPCDGRQTAIAFGIAG